MASNEGDNRGGLERADAYRFAFLNAATQEMSFTQRRRDPQRRQRRRKPRSLGLNFSAVLFGLCVKSGLFHMADARSILAPLQIPRSVKADGWAA
jgi:hypothetical protein